MRRSLAIIRHAVVGLVAGLVLGGCVGGGGGDDDALELEGVGTTLVLIGDGLSMAVPDGSSITVTVEEPGAPLETPRGGEGCSTRSGSITIGDGDRRGRIEMERWSPGCRHPVFLNGAYGWFAGADHVSDATAVAELSSPAGPVTYLEHPYTECTNSCTTWSMRYALLVQAAPTDPEHPVLALVTPADSGIDLALFAATLTTGS
ncbi:MAG: hypothetical protein R2761_00065 [Acidimicrobiales bacterium]